MLHRAIIAIRIRALILAATLGMVAAVLSPATAIANSTAAAARVYPPIFHTREIESSNLRPFVKWESVLERYADNRKLAKERCTAGDPDACHFRDWLAFLHSLKGEGKMAQLQAVNRYTDRHPYVTDPVNYHVIDYWATPRQFLDLDGDCEDYAIAKYYSLRKLGFDRNDMRIVVLEDMNLRLPHAILVVYLGGVAYVLDNQIPEVVNADIIHHYRPFYSINETHWWLHRPF